MNLKNEQNIFNKFRKNGGTIGFSFTNQNWHGIFSECFKIVNECDLPDNSHNN